MDKVYKSGLDAVVDIPSGASIMFGGFGRAGLPVSLMHALKRLADEMHEMRLHG